MRAHESERYPDSPTERDRWILSRRPPRNRLDPNRAYAFLSEEEPEGDGTFASISTIFLTNRECPWRCLMCDLWRNTLEETVPPGAIVAQIDDALAHLPPGRQIKLYNAGSFFDRRAIPIEDHPEIAARLQSFERIVVECHPALVGEPVLRFRDRLPGKLEVAIGLETVHPDVLPRLNKRMTLERFAQAAAFLHAHEIDLRTFVLLKPPFLDEAEGEHWAKRSIDFALQQHARVVSVIPTRLGNGALERLAAAGQFSPPRLRSLERVLSYGLEQRRNAIVLADAWDLEQFADCDRCFQARRSRLVAMNRTQRVQPEVSCSC